MATRPRARACIFHKTLGFMLYLLHRSAPHCNIHATSNVLISPEWPEVSIAVPKKSTYSVRLAWSRYMAPIHPPAFTNIHSV